MKKEILVAIVLGFGVGIFIALGAYNANRAIKTKKSENAPASSEKTPPPSPLDSQPTLTISEPENNLVLREKEATISGQTDPESTIAILAEKQEELLLADKQGLFSAKISLISGINEIKIIAISRTGKEQEASLTLVYTEAEIE